MKILVWNIQFFTDKRITGKWDPVRAVRDVNDANALANLSYILSTVHAADPDVFVILETLSTKGELGSLAEGEGPEGLLHLLRLLKLQSNDWQLVPPLRVNPEKFEVEGLYNLNERIYTETVGVFWRSNAVAFTGPVPRFEGYPPPWDDASGNATWAAQCQFYEGGPSARVPKEIHFPSPKHRRPYLTTFKEPDAPLKPGRTVKLFSIHTTPKVAPESLAQLASPEWWQPGDNEVTVFAGDFNVARDNPWKRGGAEVLYLPSEGLSKLTVAFPPFKYPSSLLRVRREADPVTYSVGGQLLDWALVKYGPNTERPSPDPWMAVIDRVSGLDAIDEIDLPEIESDMSVNLDTIKAIGASPPYALRDHMGAVRTGGTSTTFTTTVPHELEAGDFVEVVGVQGDLFDGEYVVTEVTPDTFTAAHEVRRPRNAAGGGGSVLHQPILNVFRRRINFGHIGPPGGSMGTSDHLPILIHV